MPNQPIEDSAKQLEEIKSKIQNFELEWEDTYRSLTEAQRDIKDENLFSTIDYLTLCDQVCSKILTDLKKLDTDLNDLADFGRKTHLAPKNHALFGDLSHAIHACKHSLQNKAQEIDDEYQILAEQTLRRAQDLIAKYAECMQQEKTTGILKTEVHQNLDKELFLQELSDSLESYRQAREDFITQSLTGSTQRQSKELIEEEDSVIAQIDTALSACDTALLIRETTD